MRHALPSFQSRALLLCSSALLIPLSSTHAWAQETNPVWLDEILVTPNTSEGTVISNENPADTGTTDLGEDAIYARTDTSGDINSVLRTVPTVQYANHSDTDAGVNEVDELDLKPLEVSISGGRVTENNFMLNGIGMNSILGSDAGYGSSFKDLSRDTGVLTIQYHYGLSSHSQYVPSGFVDNVTVMDSNVSAEYGGFVGGAVDVELRKPDTEESSGFIELSYSGSSLSKYEVATEDGENPEDIEKPEFEKYSLTAEQNWAINDRTAAIFGFSTKVATASEDRDPQYVDRRTENETTSNFYRAALAHEFLSGEKLTFELDYTDYDQFYEVYNADNHGVTVANSGLILNGKYETSWDAMNILGLETRNTKLEFNAIYQKNTSLNDMSSDVYYNWYASYDTYGYVTDAFSDWCDAGDIARASCYTGAYGDKEFKDQQFEANVKLSGDIWQGKFTMGAAVRHSIAEHTGTGFDWYTSSRYNTQQGVDSFTCPANDPACIDSQYLSFWYHQNAFAVKVDATAFEGFLELDQTFGDVQVRAGVRADYNDYLENFDISPRFALSWTPNDRFSATFGANRYYDDAYATYAIMDAMPRYNMYSRDDNDGVVEDFTLLRTFEGYDYDQAGVKTPYNDELTIGFNYRDVWTEGTWRIKGIHRRGYDEFANSEDSSSFENTLTNDGRSGYDAVTLEYVKDWDMSDSQRLSSLGLYLSTVWADRWVTPESAYGSAGVVEEFYYYNDTSYIGDEFQEVTGNLDIPFRMTAELNAASQNEKLKVGLGTDVVFSYWGVRQTDEDTRTNPIYGDVSHLIYEDYKFDTVVMAYLTAEAQIAEVKGNPLVLRAKLDNMFGNAGVADDANPWVRSRSLALSMGYEW